MSMKILGNSKSLGLVSMALLLTTGFFLVFQYGANSITFQGLLMLALAFTLASVTMAGGTSNTIGIAALAFASLIFINVVFGFSIFGLSVL